MDQYLSAACSAARAYVPGIDSGDFADRVMADEPGSSCRLLTDDTSTGILKQIMADATYAGLKRIKAEDGLDGGLATGSLSGGAGFSPISGRGSSQGLGEPAPSIRFGRGADGRYRDTPHRSGTVRGGTELGRSGVGAGHDAHTRFHAAGGKGLTEAGRQHIASWMSFFMRSDAEGGMGLDRDKAMGMVGMMQGESGQNLDPNINHYDVNGPSIGTAQWHDVDGRPGGRATALRNFAAKLGKPWNDVEVQQAFWKHEALTSENKAWRAIMAARDGRGALAAGVRHYERPRSPEPEIAKRMPNYDRLARGGFDTAPGAAQIYPDEGRRGFAAQQREAERAVLPQRPPAGAAASPPQTAPASLNVKVSGLDELREAHHHIDGIHRKAASLGNVSLRTRVHHEDHIAAGAPRPGSLRTSLNGGYASDGRSWT